MTTENNTYKWDCSNVDVHPSENEQVDVVYNVHWRCLGVSDVIVNDEPLTSQVYGSIRLPFDEESDFTPFDELTNETITEWVKSTMGEASVQEIYNTLDRYIQDKANPTSVNKTIGTTE